MQSSLLSIRKLLRPLVWLLGFALFVSVSPHLTQGLVLCIGEGHIELEASGAAHHASAGAPSDLASWHVADGSAFEESEAPCIDVPLRAARGNDLCHQAVTSNMAWANVLPPEALLPAEAFLSVSGIDAAHEAAAHPFPSSDVPAASSLRALSSVVLLI